MIKLAKFAFNPFQTNTYVLSDETGECVIIDAACSNMSEQEILDNYIQNEGLKPVKLLYTHCHVDHILGNAFVERKYQLEPEVHEAGKMFWETAREFSSVFNVHLDEPLKPKIFIKDGDIISFGNSHLKTLYTPGHADGSVCFWSEEDKFVIVGDVLFRESIGRTDLPSGNYELLMQSIANKLLILDPETVVYSGHGPETTIGFEKVHNPYISIM